MSVAQRPCSEKAYIRCHGAEYTEMPEAFPIRECGQFGPHAGLEQVESIGYAASEDYHMRIESIHYNLHKPADIHPELIHKTDSIGLSGSSIFFCIFARCPFRDKKPAAAIELIVLVKIRDITYLPRPRIMPGLQSAVNHQTAANTCPKSDTDSLPVAFCLTEPADTKSKAIAVIVDIGRKRETGFQQFFKVHFFP